MNIGSGLRILGRDILLNGLIGSYAFPRRLRWVALRTMGMRVEESAISAKVFFGGTRVTIGRGTFINYGAFIDNAAPVRIGRNVDVGQSVKILTGTHEVGPSGRRAGRTDPRPVTIGDGAWIGAQAVILPGVTIGRGVVIGAGAVVTKDCVEPGIYLGTPAVFARPLDD